jgi:tripartite-type tricarboxylate transporter receptor subunit TctC
LKQQIAFSTLALVLCAPLTCTAQSYPVKPIRIVTSEAGSGNDFSARLIAQGISPALGQQIIIDNRSTAVIGPLVARALPDGYTMLSYGSSIWLAPFLDDKVGYDPIKDLAPVTLVSRAPNLLVVSPTLPVKTVKDLVDLAKAKPGQLNYGSAAAGSSSHLSAELFKSMAGVDIVRVNYKSLAQTLPDMLSGQLHIIITTPASVLPQVKAGKIFALAVTTARPSALFPEYPTISASGVPGYEASTLTAVFVPAKTAPSIVARLNQEIARALNRGDIKEKLMGLGTEPVGSSAEQLADTVKSEMTKWGKVIREAGIH